MLPISNFHIRMDIRSGVRVPRISNFHIRVDICLGVRVALAVLLKKCFHGSSL